MAIIYRKRPLAVVFVLLAGLGWSGGTACTQQLASGTFDTVAALADWQVVSPQFSSHDWSTDDAANDPLSGSMTGINQATVAFGTAQYRQCVTGVQAGQLLALTVTLRIPTQTESGWASGSMTPYDNGTCNGGSFAGIATPLVSSTAPDVWTTVTSVGLTLPEGIQSLDVRVFVNKSDAGNTFTVDIDDAFLLDLGIFSDGFESGNLSAWSASVP